MGVFRCRLTALVGLLVALAWHVGARTALAGDIVVSGAASLTSAMTEIKNAFQASHPDRKVYVNFASSGQLLQQIEAGAPVDVFAPADQETMDRAQQHGLIDASSRVDFTANDLMLVVPCDSKDVHCAKDLTDAKVDRIALGEPDAVPAGSYTKQALANLGLWDTLSPKMVYGLSVKQALDYVALGEVGAAFIYGTDARLAPDRIRIIMNMGGHNPIVYPAAVVAGSAQKDGAREFIAFLTSDAGQTILTKYGFKNPGAVKEK